MADNYKNTMNLPKTDFPMRGDLAHREPEILKKWQEEDIYGKVLEKNKDGEPFVLHDGPPYANGPIHIGHAFNKILKDFVIKSHAQRGYYTPYVPGWDCHGQPIEHIIEKQLGTEKMKSMPQSEVRSLCHDWAVKCVDLQREGFKRLGVNADWDHPYLTFTPNYESGNVEIFKKMYLDGSIYRGRKPIHWCSRCHTALAEAEIEYGDETSPSIYVNFVLDETPKQFAETDAKDKTPCVLIWTTTPWTLPANTAVSLAPTAEYVMVILGDKAMLMAKELVETVAEVAGWKGYTLAKDSNGEVVTTDGVSLCGLTYTCPIRQDLKGKVIYGDHVTLDSGTGCVHTAPGHGVEDYVVASQFEGVATLMPVDDDGILTEEAGQFAGLSTDDSNPKIIEWLEEQGTLVAKVSITHSYPHCWRCHEPVIFRATDQWFVSMDKTGLRKKAKDEIDNNVKWIPEWASNRIGAMVEDRPDWCISRQRSWGVPIPVFKCAKCGETIATEETFDAVINLFNTEGADAWFTKKPSEYLPAGVKCEHCGCEELIPEKDILDVWWESGVSHDSVLKHRANEGLTWPADMYLEGSDQHRGWFQSSLLTSVGAYGRAPYKSVMHCGFTVDEKGRKMSKSLGNGVDPSEVVNKVGADVLRMWVSSVDYSQDVSISDSILQRTSDAYRKFRNIFRFLLGNLDDFTPADRVTSYDDLEPIDKWVMAKLAEVLNDVNKAYENYKFHYVYRVLYEFVNNDLSAIYMDVAKDRLYSEAANSPRRRAVQTVLENVLDVLVRVLSPILSFTTEEVWGFWPEGLKEQERPVSVQLAGWPNAKNFTPEIPENEANEVLDDFKTLFEIRDAATKAIEVARGNGTIKKSQEAKVTVTLSQEQMNIAAKFDKSVIADLLICAEVEFVVENVDETTAKVDRTNLAKCPRCWNYTELSGEGEHADVCPRCAHVLG
ncbi:isoleucine--tRNA ligase [Phoenicibacter congonensis]|uniref:isoleucine--tRNA ligase n=1 Tax=Phoenicibacter congonensis TaxID=1944646 RepID=UPI0009A63E3A|nr:isoleucine--tRNA ligase [Phoenicibacter congonensis]